MDTGAEQSLVGSRPEAPCLVCRARKVKCDRARPACGPCIRLEIQCPGYQGTPKLLSQAEVSRSAAGIFEASGVVKRRIGSCVECRRSKCRCSRTRPTCKRCEEKGFTCTYSGPGEATADGRDPVKSPTPLTATPGHNPSTPVLTTPSASLVPLASSGGGSDAGRSVGESWLFAESIPEDPRLLRSLIDAYFEHVHPLRCLGFVHKPTFMRALERGVVKDEYIEALIYIMCAFGAKYLSWESHNRLPLYNDENEAPGLQWARKARDIAMRGMDIPSVQNLMALILISEYGASAHGNAIAFVLAGCCHRLARLLGLDHSYDANIKPGAEACDQESRRRLMWSCFVLDSIVGSGVDTHNSSKYSLPDIPLPAPDEDFLAQYPNQTGENLQAMERPEVAHNINYRGQLVYLVLLRTQVLRLIRQSLSAGDVENPRSPFRELLDNLESWYANMPSRLRVSDINIYIHKELNTLGAVFSLHFLYHAAITDLTRVSLPGFNFPLARTFEHVSDEFRQDCRQRCRHHADEISRLIEIGLRHGVRPFDDTFCFAAAYEVTKVQIIHSTTATPRRGTGTDHGQAEANIRCNIRLMTLMGRDGSHVLVRPLISLLSRFGFRKLALEWDPRSPATDAEGAEISGPADSNHLSSVSTLRLARAEMQRHQSSANVTSPTFRSSTDAVDASSSSATTATQHHRRQRSGVHERTTTESPVLEHHSTTSSGHPQQQHYPDQRGDRTRYSSTLQQQQQQQQHNDNTSPHTSMDFNTSLQPSTATGFGPGPSPAPTGGDTMNVAPLHRILNVHGAHQQHQQQHLGSSAAAAAAADMFPGVDASSSSASFLDAPVSSNDDVAAAYDYTNLAAEMSDYITWNAADYTPWGLNFHPYSTTDDTAQHHNPQYHTF